MGVLSYELGNLFGNWKSGTWNVLPAVLTTWSNLLSNQGNKTTYELYKEQASEYINTAKDNAELIRNKGKIALRNLEYKDRLERGADVAKVGAAGGNLSGSTLYNLVQKEKIRKANEMTVNADYTNQAMLELYNGYRQAGSAYGSLAIKAQSDRAGAWASIFKGLETYVGLQVADAKVESSKTESRRYSETTSQMRLDRLNKDNSGLFVSDLNNSDTYGLFSTDKGFNTSGFDLSFSTDYGTAK
jgi:hypothetical protein